MTRQKNGTWKLTDKEMLMFSIYAAEARNGYRKQGLNAIAEEANNFHNNIYDTLDRIGYYN